MGCSLKQNTFYRFIYTSLHFGSIYHNIFLSQYAHKIKYCRHVGYEIRARLYVIRIECMK